MVKSERKHEQSRINRHWLLTKQCCEITQLIQYVRYWTYCCPWAAAGREIRALAALAPHKLWHDALLCSPPRAQLLCKEWLMPRSISWIRLCILYTAAEACIWVWTGRTCTELMRAAKTRGTLGLATSHQVLAGGTEVILPEGHRSPVQESNFNLNQLFQSIHCLLQHLLPSGISTVPRGVLNMEPELSFAT